MAEDVREAIMARLVVLMGTIPGVHEVARNVLLSDDAEDQSKRIVVLEGEETIDEDDLVRTGNRPALAPTIMRMQPQILLQNFAASETVGSGLSVMRAAVIKKIASDSELIGMTVKGRGGVYLGMASDLAFAKAMAGETSLKFQFTYLLRPDQL